MLGFMGHLNLPIEQYRSNKMDAVIVSSTYQIVIPKEIRESMGIVSGQKIQMIAYRNRIELIPIKPIAQMRGFLRGIDTEVIREGDRV
jgi:AbrB family looped-hinge helix DNA binding protein